MDWKWAVTAVLPVITLVLGAWLTQVSEGRREDAALKREAQVRELDREQARLDRREAFELTHLAEASECLHRLHLAALITHVSNTNPAIESQAAEFQQQEQAMTRLQGLILDEEIRALVNRAQSHLSRFAYSKVETVQQMVGTQELVGAAQEALAKRLRDIYGTAADPALRP